MKKTFLYILLLISSPSMFGQTQKIVATDIDNFWEAYDKITSTTDSILQHKYLKELYLDKGTVGLQSLVQVRNYTDQQYIDAINNYPKFWQSIRSNTQNYKTLYPEIEADIEMLQKIYPAMKTATVYLAMGVFRTGGTTLDDRVLIGCELSLADKNTIVEELPEWRQPFYKQYNPIKDIGLLCTHEYIHTQQKKPLDNLLSYSLNEGIAEFISCLATGKKSTTPAIAFGKANHEKVFNKFSEDLFFQRLSNWMWGENLNELKERDLGYFIGYEIAERYYNLSSDKQKAIKELIELDYTNEMEVERIVDTTKVFNAKLKKLWENYNEKIPTVINVAPLQKNKKIKPGLVQLSITFSQQMDTDYRGFDYGPLGENYIYQFKKMVGWSNNDKTLTIEVEVGANRKYQTLITNGFRNKNGIRLKPYLIEFETKSK